MKKKIINSLMALLIFAGMGFAFLGNVYAEGNSYPGDGAYTINVYHDHNMTSQPMKGKVDKAFVEAIITKKESGKYRLQIKTQKMKYLGVSGEIKEMTIDGKNSISAPLFVFDDINLTESNGVITAKNVSAKMELMGFIHKNVNCFMKFTKK